MFSHTVGSLCNLVLFSLAVQKLFILMRSHLFILSFMSSRGSLKSQIYSQLVRSTGDTSGLVIVIWRRKQSCRIEPSTYGIWWYLQVDSVIIELNYRTPSCPTICWSAWCEPHWTWCQNCSGNSLFTWLWVHGREYCEVFLFSHTKVQGQQLSFQCFPQLPQWIYTRSWEWRLSICCRLTTEQATGPSWASFLWSSCQATCWHLIGENLPRCLCEPSVQG